LFFGLGCSFGWELGWISFKGFGLGLVDFVEGCFQGFSLWIFVYSDFDWVWWICI